MKKVCILGLGYIGLPTAAMFAMQKLDVVGVDINDAIIQKLNSGGIHIQETGLEEVVQQAIQTGHLRPSLKVEPADAFIIAVPTPFYDDKKADMRAVISAAEAIVPHLRRGNLVILESTSPPLTTAGLVQPILERFGLRAGADFYLAYSPERVLPGKILHELVYNARVIGGIDAASAQAGRDLYAIFVQGEIIQTDATTAEMVKLMENTYRDVNIAIANEFSRLADRFGIDVWEAIQIANLHPRVKILNPGPGVGGHCISVDPWFLVEAAPDLTRLILASRQVNDSQPHYVMEIVRQALGGQLAGKRIAALGLSYKPDVDDLRESPAVEAARMLAEAGALVTAFEPHRPEEQFEAFQTAASLPASVRRADLVLALVAHQEFRQIQPADLAALTPARLVVDTVHIWPAAAWEPAGFRLVELGARRNSNYASLGSS